MNLKTLGEKVRMYRNLKGYSQEGLAKTAGISQSQVSFIEKNKNKKKCDEVIVKKICKALQITEDELQNFGEIKNEIYGGVINDLNKKDSDLLDKVLKDEKSMINLLNTIELLSKIIASYKIKLEECEHKKK